MLRYELYSNCYKRIVTNVSTNAKLSLDYRLLFYFTSDKQRCYSVVVCKSNRLIKTGFQIGAAKTSRHNRAK